jgi:nucleoside-triphosphatase
LPSHVGLSDSQVKMVNDSRYMVMSSLSGVKRAFLLCGEPGCGKTTVIKEVLAKVNRSAGGFYTEEIRDHGSRQGFRIVTLDGKKAILARTPTKSRYRVGKYGVDIENMDEVAAPAVREAVRACDIVVIDEIGKMELFSSAFKEAVIEALESGKMILGTIMLASHPWADGVKKRAEVEVMPVTKVNRGEVADRVLRWLGS